MSIESHCFSNLSPTAVMASLDNTVSNSTLIDGKKKLLEYEKIKLIGRGSFGSAFLVKVVADGKLRVMKQIPILDMSVQEYEDAINEVKVLSLLHHPNIIGYEQSFIAEGALNIIMDYADGGDLSEAIKKANGSHFKEEIILNWFVQIAMALNHVHQQNILHRDLKSSNVFLTTSRPRTVEQLDEEMIYDETNIVKLGDFGIARVMNTQTHFAKTCVGTPYYLSPEICQDMPYNQKSDVWSLGCLLYEITTLRHAFDGNNLPSLVLKILRGVYPPISQQYSTDLRSLIDAMLQLNPDDRPTIDQILSLPFIQKRVVSLLKKFKHNTNAAVKHEPASAAGQSNPKSVTKAETKAEMKPVKTSSRKVSRQPSPSQKSPSMPTTKPNPTPKPSVDKGDFPGKSNVPKNNRTEVVAVPSAALREYEARPNSRPSSNQSKGLSPGRVSAEKGDKPPLFPNISSRSIKTQLEGIDSFGHQRLSPLLPSPTHESMLPSIPHTDDQRHPPQDGIHSNPLLAKEAEGFRMRREQRLMMHQRRLREAQAMVEEENRDRDPLTASRMVTVRLEDIPVIPEMDRNSEGRRSESEPPLRRKSSFEAPPQVEKPVIRRKTKSAGSKLPPSEEKKISQAKPTLVTRLTPQEIKEERLRKEEAKRKAEEAKQEMKKREKELKQQVSATAPKIQKQAAPFRASPRDGEGRRQPSEKEFFVEIVCDKVSLERVSSERQLNSKPTVDPSIGQKDSGGAVASPQSDEHEDSDEFPVVSVKDSKHEKDMEDVQVHLKAVLSNHRVTTPASQLHKPHIATSSVQSLGVRIEHLRQLCEKQLGDNFLRCYQYVRQITEASNSSDVAQAPTFLSDLEVPVIRYVNQLIYYEDMLYGNHSQAV